MADQSHLSLPPPPSGLSRRAFLGLVVAGAAAACTDGGEGAADGTTTSAPASTTTTVVVPDLPLDPFTLGVASGDPLADSVILWTRLAPEPIAGGGMPDQPVPVTWQVFADGEGDPGDEAPLQEGTAIATASLGHSVHVDVSGLDPDTWYRYRFVVGDWSSEVARTRTAPAADAAVDQVRFAFASCQHWESGEWTAYPHLVADAPDLVFFLGDYIYEYAEREGETPSQRRHNGGEIVALPDYRNRWALYKSDARLRAAHATCPWVVTWDDHEVENDYADDVSEDEAPTEEFLARRAAAYQAFYEHQPVRVDPPEGPDLTIHRSLPWGDLVTFAVLDTRQYRSDHVCGVEGLGGTIGPPCDEMHDPEHRLLGEEQEAWLGDVLRSSAATWHVLANQTVFTPLPFGGLRNLDQWDGYPDDRQRLLDLLVADGIANPVVITGDIHASGVGDIHASPEDESTPIVATELVGTSISSDAGEELATVAPIARAVPWVRYIDTEHRGYVLCTVTHDELRAQYRLVETAFEPTSELLADAPTFVITAGTPGATQV